MGPIAPFQYVCRESSTPTVVGLLLEEKDVIAAKMVEFVRHRTFVHALLVGEDMIALNLHAQ